MKRSVIAPAPSRSVSFWSVSSWPVSSWFSALSVAAGVVLLEFPPGQRAEALIVLVLLVGEQ